MEGIYTVFARNNVGSKQVYIQIRVKDGIQSFIKYYHNFKLYSLS